MAAAYTANVSATDDESFEFTCEWTMVDGTDFPWADYTFAYTLGYRGCGPILSLTDASGVVVTEADNLITFAAPVATRLAAGTYEHGCRITHIATGKVVQVFDGTVIVTEGNF